MNFFDHCNQCELIENEYKSQKKREWGVQLEQGNKSKNRNRKVKISGRFVTETATVQQCSQVGAGTAAGGEKNKTISIL